MVVPPRTSHWMPMIHWIKGGRVTVLWRSDNCYGDLKQTVTGHYKWAHSKEVPPHSIGSPSGNGWQRVKGSSTSKIEEIDLFFHMRRKVVMPQILWTLILSNRQRSSDWDLYALRDFHWSLIDKRCLEQERADIMHQYKASTPTGHKRCYSSSGPTKES